MGSTMAPMQELKSKKIGSMQKKFFFHLIGAGTAFEQLS